MQDLGDILRAAIICAKYMFFILSAAAGKLSELNIMSKHIGNSHEPPHPGVYLRMWMPEEMTATKAAKELQISRAMFSKVLNGKSCITANMAIRLHMWLGIAPDLWLGLQNQWDLWQARQLPIPEIKPMEQNPTPKQGVEKHPPRQSRPKLVSL